MTLPGPSPLSLSLHLLWFIFGFLFYPLQSCFLSHLPPYLQGLGPATVPLRRAGKGSRFSPDARRPPTNPLLSGSVSNRCSVPELWSGKGSSMPTASFFSHFFLFSPFFHAFLFCFHFPLLLFVSFVAGFLSLPPSHSAHAALFL